MKKLFRNILIVALTLPILAILLVWFFFLKPTAESRINSFISSPQSPIQDGKFRVFFLGAHSLSPLTLLSNPVPILLDSLSLQLSPWSLFRLSPQLNLNSNFLGGNLAGKFSYKISTKAGLGQIEVSDVQLAKHQFANLLGITSGTISASFEGKFDSSNKTGTLFVPNRMSFRLKGLSKPKASKIPKFISEIPINIPAIQNGDLIVEAICNQKQCQSSQLSFTSSLGQANGTFTLPSFGEGEVQGAITIALTHAGRQEILPYFGLLNQNILSSPNSPFILRVSGSTSNPKVSVVPIENSL